ncbi:hypothetical protein VTK56DRAFT_5346 [Thermocarpiscus australiensis]
MPNTRRRKALAKPALCATAAGELALWWARPCNATVNVIVSFVSFEWRQLPSSRRKSSLYASADSLRAEQPGLSGRPNCPSHPSFRETSSPQSGSISVSGLAGVGQAIKPMESHLRITYITSKSSPPKRWL